MGCKISEGARENNNDWIREGASTERVEKIKSERVGQSAPLLFASNQKDLLIYHREAP